MPMTFKVDQAATFKGLAFNTSAPKMQFGTQNQETDPNGIGKWEVQVTAMSEGFQGKIETEVLKVGVVSATDPGEGLMPFTPVQLVGFEIGVMDKTTRDRNTGETKVIGAQVWYRAQEVRPINAAPTSGRGSKADA